MSLFVVDVEADGPCPGLYSMVSLGCVRVDRDMQTTFHATFAPISRNFDPDALAVSKIDRDTHERYPEPQLGILAFSRFLRETSLNGSPVFMSDNPAFDWQWVNYYCHMILGRNPFGHSGRRIGDFYAGLERDFKASSAWKKLRKTKHTHHPVDDARGNVEALIAFTDKHGIKLPE